MTALQAPAPNTWQLDAGDEALLDRAFTEFKDYDARQLHRLMWDGEVTEPSPSEADWHFLTLIARLTRDPEQIERLWYASAVGSAPGRSAKLSRHDYAARTITAALRRTEREWKASQLPLPSGAATPDRPLFRSLAEMWADPDAGEAPEVVIPRLAWEGRVTVLAAPDKAGKSTLVSAAVGQLKDGGAFLGDPCRPCITLWVMLEEHRNDLLARAETFGTARDLVHVMEHPADPGADVRRAAERLRPDLIVVDTLVRFAGDRVSEGGSAAQWTPVMAELQALARDLECAVLVLHHSRRSDGEARDSGEITARADVVIEQKTRHQDGVQRFAVRARWPLADFAVRLMDGKRYELAADGEGRGQLSPQQAKVLSHLKAGMTRPAWEKASAVPHATFVRAVEALLTRDEVEVADDGAYRPCSF